MERKVKTKVQGFRTFDGAGVKLVRVLDIEIPKNLIQF